MLMYKSLELSDKNNNGDEIVNNVTLTKIENMKKVLSWRATGKVQAWVHQKTLKRDILRVFLMSHYFINI